MVSKILINLICILLIARKLCNAKGFFFCVMMIQNADGVYLLRIQCSKCQM